MFVLTKDVSKEICEILGKKKFQIHNFIRHNTYRKINLTTKKEISKDDYLFIVKYYKAKAKKQLEKKEIKNTKWSEFSEVMKFAQINVLYSPQWEILFLIQDILKVSIQEFYQEAPETVKKRLKKLKLI